MNYFINLGLWGKIFAVPSEVVDKHLKIANPVHIKVLLYLLSHSGEQLAAETVAKCCGVCTEDVEDAVTYWTEAEIISSVGGCITQKSSKSTSAVWEEKTVAASASATQTEVSAVKTEPQSQKTKKLAPSLPARPSHEECAKLLAGSEALQALVDGAQSALGRLLSRADTDTLISLNQWAGMSTDVILVAVCHCGAMGKGNMRYIEKVVLGWQDSGIDTVSKADAYIKRKNLRNSAWSTVMSVAGIEFRKPSEREADFCEKWVEEWGFDRTMLRLAYDTCVNSTGKLAFSYMNKILERWHTQGISTPEELKTAVADEKKAASGKSEKKRKSSYDLDELEKRLNSDFAAQSLNGEGSN